MVLPVKLLLDLLLLELLPKETQLLLFVESGDSAGLYCVERGFKIAEEGFVSAVEFDVIEVALLLPPPPPPPPPTPKNERLKR